MTVAAVQQVDVVGIAKTRLTSAQVVGEYYRYLDLDGDGVPDAVEYLTSVEVDIDDDGTRMTEKVRRVESRIDVDGTPGEVYVDDRLWLPDGRGSGFELEVTSQ
jgi:hypothetical protein